MSVDLERPPSLDLFKGVTSSGSAPWVGHTLVCTDDGGVRLAGGGHWPWFRVVLYKGVSVGAFAADEAIVQIVQAGVTVPTGRATPPGLVEPPHVAAVRWIKDATALSDERIARLAGVERQTLLNWQRGRAISNPNRQRLYAVREILERASRRHPSPEHLVAWLYTPAGTDGLTPAQLLEAGDLDQARYLAVASPSPDLQPPPAWVRRPVPPAFKKGAEHPMEALPPEEADVNDALRDEP